MEQLICAIKRSNDESLGSPSGILGMVHEWRGMGESLLNSLVERVKEIESREKNLNLDKELVEKRLRELVEREKEFELSEKRKRVELALKEGELRPAWDQDVYKGVRLREEKLDEMLESVREHIGSLEVAQGEVEGMRVQEREKLRVVERREREVDAMRRECERRLKEVEEMEKEFVEEVEGMRVRECEKLKAIERREREVDVMRGECERRLKEVEEREKEFEEVEAVREREELKAIERREREVDFMRVECDRRLKEVEERERDFELLRDRRKRELDLREGVLSRKREEFVKEVGLANKKFEEGQKLGLGLIKRLEVALTTLEGMKVNLDERFKERKLWEIEAYQSLEALIDEAELIRVSVEKRIEEFEKIEMEFCSAQDEKFRKLDGKERRMITIKKELVKELRLRDERLTEKQKLGHQLLESLEATVAKKLKEIESHELSLNVARETLDACAKDADLVRESADVLLKELDKREEEFHIYQEKRERELASKEETLAEQKEKCDKKEEEVNELLELQVAQNQVKDMNAVVKERFKEICLKENSLSITRESVDKKMVELELKETELNEKEERIKTKEDSLISKENELEVMKRGLQMKEQGLVLEEPSLGSQAKKIECKGQELQELSLIARESGQTCSKEHIAFNNLERPKGNLNVKRAGHLARKDQKLQCKLGELDKKHIRDNVIEPEVKRQQLTDAVDTDVRTEPVTRTEQKALAVVVNNTEKSLELIGDEAFKVLLSPDPAKLVLDAMVELYEPHWGKGDTETKSWRISILLLDHLTKMSQKIQPCVRGSAIRVATKWKSEMKTTGENSMEVLAFLHFLAAYDLSSCFGRDELFSFLKRVAHHKQQTPQLLQIPGFMEDISGFIQNLISEKQYLLASFYIYECELEHMFPQAAVLNYYVKHSCKLAKAECKVELNSLEAQEKAISRQIADLQVAVDHIAKYGLESEYSPVSLKEQIEHLEWYRANLTNRTREENSYGNGRRAQQKYDTTKDDDVARKGQLPDRVVERTPVGSNAHHQQKTTTEKPPPTAPVSFPANMEGILSDLRKRSDVDGDMVRCLEEACKEIKLRKSDLDLARESVVERMMEVENRREEVGKRFRELEEKEREFDCKRRRLVGGSGEEEEEVVLVGTGGNVGREEALVARERKVDMVIGTLDGRIRAVEEKEKEFDVFLEGKMKEVVAKEEELGKKWEEFVQEVRYVKFKSKRLEGLKRRVGEREAKCSLFMEDKMREVEAKEDELGEKYEKVAEEVKLAEVKFRDQEELTRRFMERVRVAESKLESTSVAINERIEEIEARGSAAWQTLAASVNEVDSIEESMRNQLKEIDQKRTAFVAFHQEKTRELVLKEEQLRVLSKNLVRDAKLRDKELSKGEKSVHGLLKKLESAQNNVLGLKKEVDLRVNEIGLKEVELNSVRDWVEEKMDEADIKVKELEDREKEIKRKESDLASLEKELWEKKEELDLKEKNLVCREKEVEIQQKDIDLAQESNEKRSVDLDWREKCLNSVKEFTRNCFKEHRALKKQLQLETDSVKQHERDLEHKEQLLERRAIDLDFKEKQIDDSVKALEFRKQEMTNALNVHVKEEPEECVDVIFVVKMDGKTLQMFLNDPEKDLDSLGDEIFKVLHLSSDPAKLVLDAMEGFYPPHLRKEDVELNVRRTCIAILEQLHKMSRKIQPSVREEAFKLASEWKSKMGSTAGVPLELLGFLYLVAAFNLSSYFDKSELLGFVKMVSQQMQAPELSLDLGLMERIIGIYSTNKFILR